MTIVDAPSARSVRRRPTQRTPLPSAYLVDSFPGGRRGKTVSPWIHERTTTARRPHYRPEGRRAHHTQSGAAKKWSSDVTNVDGGAAPDRHLFEAFVVLAKETDPCAVGRDERVDGRGADRGVERDGRQLVEGPHGQSKRRSRALVDDPGTVWRKGEIAHCEPNHHTVARGDGHTQ